MTYDPSGPVAALAAMGVPTPHWALEGEHRTETETGARWSYRDGFIGTVSAVAVAHLVANGWNTAINPSRTHRGLDIRFQRPENKK